MLRRKTILIVEDDDDLRSMFSDALKFADFDVREASDGVDALRVIEAERPDLVVLDVRLPMLDGVSVWQEIAARPPAQRIPVLIVTGMDGFELPGATVLRKPVTPNELIGAIRRFLRTEW